MKEKIFSFFDNNAVSITQECFEQKKELVEKQIPRAPRTFVWRRLFLADDREIFGALFARRFFTAPHLGGAVLAGEHGPSRGFGAAKETFFF